MGNSHTKLSWSIVPSRYRLNHRYLILLNPVNVKTEMYPNYYKDLPPCEMSSTF